MYCIYRRSTHKVISFSQNLSPRFILKNFANFSLDILIKHILMNRKECSWKCYSSFASMYSIISCWILHFLVVLGQLVGTNRPRKYHRPDQLTLVSEDSTSHAMHEVSLMKMRYIFITIYIFSCVFSFLVTRAWWLKYPLRRFFLVTFLAVKTLVFTAPSMNCLR